MRMLLGLAMALCVSVATAQTGPSSIAVADVHKLADITGPAFAPDGERLAYAVETDDLKEDAATSDLWLTRWSGGKPQQVTRTPGSSEWQPGWSADGRTLVFLSDAAKDGTTQLWRMAARGGAARQVTRIPGGIEDYALSPDGRRAVVIAEVGASVGLDEDKTTPPIVIDRYYFKEDYRDWLDDRRLQLFVVDLGTGKAEQISSGDFDHWLPAWSPDGSMVAFVSNRSAEGDRAFGYDLFVMRPEKGAAVQRISNFAGADNDPAWESRPAWSPDSRKLVWLTGGEDKWIYYAPTQLSVADVASGAVTTPARIDKWFSKPRWSTDGRSILAIIEQDKASWLARINPETGAVDYLTGGTAVVSDYAEGAGIAVLESTPVRPARLRQAGGNGAILADANSWIDQRALAGTMPLQWRAADGNSGLALLTLPPGFDNRARLPLIVDVHGGPVSQFAMEFMIKWQVLAAQGYAVLAVNPRGSSGRGFDYARAIYADWGNKDVIDVKAGIDAAIASGVIDDRRIGIGGWSYGGILTNYMIASDPRIRAAVSGAGLSNVFATWGHDMYIREYALELGTPWDNDDIYRRVSYPFFKPQGIAAATLFLCAEKDFNVPCVGAEQMYQLLKTRNVPTRLVIYPGENHGLTIPSYRADRLQRTLDWYATHLKAE